MVHFIRKDAFQAISLRLELGSCRWTWLCRDNNTSPFSQLSSPSSPPGTGHNPVSVPEHRPSGHLWTRDAPCFVRILRSGLFVPNVPWPPTHRTPEPLSALTATTGTGTDPRELRRTSKDLETMEYLEGEHEHDLIC